MSSKAKGEQLYLFINNRPVGCSTECSVDLSAGVIEVAATGGWRCFRPNHKAWSMGCSGFYFEDSELPTNFIKGSQAIGTQVTVAMTVLGRALVEAGINLETITPDAVHTITGEAIITDCRYAGAQGTMATYSIQLQGSGEIKPI